MAEAFNRVLRIDNDWAAYVREEAKKPYFARLMRWLKGQYEQGKTIYPPQSRIFRAFQETPPERVKVLILGQDPYHEPNQANGLAFSSDKGNPVPRSLQNVYAEIAACYPGYVPPRHADLSHWAHQGVMLLNSSLTVERSIANSHRDKGWEPFTDGAIARLADSRDGVVFMLWGSAARRKAGLIDPKRHLILQCPHPSPLSASRGFFGCRHFLRANEYLASRGEEPIDWLIRD